MGHFNGANSTWWEQYVPFDGRLFWYYTAATNISRYFHVNALGSLGLATDQTGSPVEEMLYYPFGDEWENSTGFGWNEKFARLATHDNELGMYMTPHRQYNTGLGRWMSPDLMGGDVTNPQSLNRYAYALNNPATLNDPLGLYVHSNLPGWCLMTDPYCQLEWNQLNGVGADGGILTVWSWALIGTPALVGGSAPGGGGLASSVPPAGQPPVTGGTAPSYSQVLKSFNNCAAKFADKYSVASLLHLNNSLIGNALLGSTTAAASDLIFQRNPKVYVPAGTSLTAAAQAGTAVKLGAIAVGKLPTGGTIYAYTGATVATPYGPALEMGPAGETLADTALGSSALGGVKALGGLLDIALPAQILYDEALYGIGEAACTAQAF